MRIDFPLWFKDTQFGRLSDPKIPVPVRARRGLRVQRFLLDTGADFSLAPLWLARVTGLDWQGMPPATVTGVEQGTIPARYGRLPIRLAGLDFEIRCLFLHQPDAIFVLGRADFLDRFVLTIDQPRRRIVPQAVDA